MLDALGRAPRCFDAPRGAGLEAEAAVPGFQDVSVVRKAWEAMRASGAADDRSVSAALRPILDPFMRVAYAARDMRRISSCFPT